MLKYCPVSVDRAGHVATGCFENHIPNPFPFGQIDALLGVDLSQAKIVAKDDTARQATIELPLPELLTSGVDHSRTQTWQVRKTAWMPWSGDGDKLRDQVMKEAQKLVASAAVSEEYIGQSKAAAQAIIAAFFAELGWSVEVRWAEGSGANAAAEAR